MDKDNILKWMDRQIVALEMAKTPCGNIKNIEYVHSIQDPKTFKTLYEDAIHVNNINELISATGIEPVINEDERYIVYKGVAFFDVGEVANA
jgi:hypothetical protein